MPKLLASGMLQGSFQSTSHAQVVVSGLICFDICRCFGSTVARSLTFCRQRREANSFLEGAWQSLSSVRWQSFLGATSLSELGGGTLVWANSGGHCLVGENSAVQRSTFRQRHPINPQSKAVCPSLFSNVVERMELISPTR